MLTLPVHCTRTRALLLPLVLLAVADGCGDQSLRPDPKLEPADLYWSLELNHHAVAMADTAPYDTLQLVATPRNYRDEPLAGLPAPQYRSTDPERVVVMPDGQLIALAPTAQPVSVVATLTANNLKHVDTVLVSVVVTAMPPVLDSFSIHPVPPDSAKVGASVWGNWEWFDTLPARTTTPGGDPIPIYGRDAAGYLPVYFHSSDTAIAKVNSAGVLKGIQAGSVDIYASTTAFGIRKADTLVYRVGAPVAAVDYIIADQLSGDKRLNHLTPSITIGLGGAVIWGYRPVNDTDTLDITFTEADFPNVAVPQSGIDFLGVEGWLCTDPAQCSGANFLLSWSQGWGGRYFRAPGIYEYRSVRQGITGRVVVVDER